MTDILQGNTDVFISIPVDVLDAAPQVARILLGSLATMFLRQNERATHDTLFIVDEMPRLGNLQVLATARDIARKYGLYIWAIVQDFGQLEKAYETTGARSWMASAAVFQLFGVNDPETARMAVERCGKYTAIQKSSSTSQGRSQGTGAGSTSTNRSTSDQLTAVDLISVDEVMTLAVDEDGTPNEQLLFIRGQRPLRCGLAKYFRRADMAGLVKDNPFYRPPPRHARRGLVPSIVAAVVLLAALVVGVATPVPLRVGDVAFVKPDAPVFLPTGARLNLTLPEGYTVPVDGIRPDFFVSVRLRVSGQDLPVLIHNSQLRVRRPLI